MDVNVKQTTTVGAILCAGCGRPCVEGSYYFKDGKALCLTCGIGSPVAEALAHDEARRRAERLPPPVPPENKEAARKLEEVARKLAVLMLERVGQIALKEGFKGADVLDEKVLAEAERLVKLARDLDLLADKVFARGAP